MTEEAFVRAKPLLKIDGEENHDLNEALSSMVINLPLSGMAHGELTFSNWIRSGENAALGFGFQDIGLGKRIEILMGENRDLTIFDGEITAIEERYGAAAPQIIFLVQDAMHILARQRHNRVFEEMSPDDIVRSISDELGLSPDVNVSTDTSTYHQMNESNLAFLMRLLNGHAISLRIVDGSLRAKPEDADAEPVELSPRDSARNIRLIADLNHQPTRITSQGFNAATNEPVQHEIEALDNPGDGITAKELCDELSWPGENIVPQPFPRTQSEAASLARAHFTRTARRFISGDIRCIGEPVLTSGREITLNDVSERLLGNYLVVHCTHSFDTANGFETHLKVSRATGQT
jgi:phage protein D